MQKKARLTSKGQVTIPRDIRRLLGLQTGDSLIFQSDEHGVRMQPARQTSPFTKYRAIGNPGIPSGRKAIRAWTRKMRGE